MRRRLLLVRHAKSSWDDPSLADHDRPLAPRGVKALLPLRDHLTRAGHRPQIVLCSSSRRTRDTLRGVRAAVPKGAQVQVDDDLYGATAKALLRRLRSLDDGIGCALLVGHNPGLQELADQLAGAGDAGDAGMRTQLSAKFPTAAAVTLSFDTSWGDLRAGGARVDDLFMPRAPRR
jgi:phosphohistidine phosphatase